MLIVDGNSLSKHGSITFCRPLKQLLHWGLTTDGAAQSTACQGPTLRWDTSMFIKTLDLLNFGSGMPHSSSVTINIHGKVSWFVTLTTGHIACMRFEVPVTVYINSTLFWDVTSCSLAEGHWWMEGMYCLHIQDWRISQESVKQQANWDWNFCWAVSSIPDIFHCILQCLQATDWISTSN